MRLCARLAGVERSTAAQACDPVRIAAPALDTETVDVSILPVTTLPDRVYVAPTHSRRTPDA
jgi:hypothetical protein